MSKVITRSLYFLCGMIWFYGIGDMDKDTAGIYTLCVMYITDPLFNKTKTPLP